MHRYSGTGVPACRHELLLRVRFPAYSNADQGAEDASWAFGESAATHLRTWWERYELSRLCSRHHERSLVGEATEDCVAASHDDEPLFGPGLRTLEVWIAPLPRNPRYLMLGSAMGAVSALAVQHRVHLLTDEDADGDLSAPH